MLLGAFRISRPSVVRWSQPIRLLSAPALARDRGVGTWDYARPYMPPFRFEHPFQVPTKYSESPLEGKDNIEDSQNEVSEVIDEVGEEQEAEIIDEEADAEKEEEELEDDERVLEEGFGETYAVVDINTRQMKVSQGALVMTDRLQLEVGEQVVFDSLLMVATKDFTVVGRPLIVGKVYATVESHDMTQKLIVFKKRRRKTYQRQNYHHSLLTLLRIGKIEYEEQAPVEPPLSAREEFELERNELGKKLSDKQKAIIPVYPKPKMKRNQRRNMARALRAEKDKLYYASHTAKLRGRRKSKSAIAKDWPDYIIRRNAILEKYSVDPDYNSKKVKQTEVDVE